MNDYFDFKTFRVHQHHSNAKVGTDAVMLGAWFQSFEKNNFLDIGTGTGVIALLAANRFPHLDITAIEPDEQSVLDAISNFQQFNSTHNFQLFNLSLKDFILSTHKRYDIIVSNPPYHTEKVLSSNHSRSQWRSENHLPFEELFQGVNFLLSENGCFSLIAPFSRFKNITSIAVQNNMFLHRYCLISSFCGESPIRFLAEFGFKYKDIINSDIHIYDEHNMYSKDYISLVGKYLI